MSDYKIWKNRFDTLYKMIDELHCQLGGECKEGGKNTAPLDIARRELFEKLVGAMKAFGKQQFDFFYKGFDLNDSIDSKKAKPYLEESAQFPVEYVLRKIIDQLSHGFDVIKKAVEQRLSSELGNALKQADLLTYQALQPAKDDTNSLPKKRLISAETTVISYFQKSPSVLIIPYAPVALIGVPFTAVNSNSLYNEHSNLRDYLAIPHEIGHYVFWRGKAGDKRLSSKLHQEIIQIGLSKYAHWLEEIFADVYGCLIGGAAYALSAQDILLDNLPSELILDDGEHPSPVLRPYISSQVLRRLETTKKVGGDESDGGFARELEKEWEGSLQKYGNPSVYQLKPNKNEHAIELIPVDNAFKTTFKKDGKIDEVAGDLVKIVGKILDELDLILGSRPKHKPWTENPEVVTGAYKYFADYINGLSSIESSTELSSEGFTIDHTNSLVYYLQDLGSRQKLETSTSKTLPEINTTEPLQTLPGKMPTALWQIVMDADGWGIGGPEGGGNPLGG